MLGWSTKRQYKDRKEVVKRSMNKNEWTRELDCVLMQSVIRNYFNFQVVAQELNHEAQARGLDFGAANVYTSEKCRIRWSYLHLQRKLGKSISYRPVSPNATASEAETDKENRNQENDARKAQKSAKKKQAQERGASRALGAKGLLEAKDFSAITERKEPKTMADIEASLWKQNIRHGPRKRQDFLDTSGEDFTLNKTRSVDGREITPSCFNIARDSLREASERLHETLNQHLPEMNLKEIEETASEGDEEVLPLDFRTALIPKENRVVIQAKPLEFKTDFDDEPQAKPASMSLDGYLEMVRKEAFREDEGAIMLDPDINIKEKFDQIQLPCDHEARMNNTINAPIREPRLGAASGGKKRGPRLPRSAKTYDTDTDNAGSDADDLKARAQGKQSNRSGDGTTAPEAGKTLGQAQLSQSFPVDGRHQEEKQKEHLRTGIVKDILQKNREALEKFEQEAAHEGIANDDILQNLEDLAEDSREAEERQPRANEPDLTEESDVAPVSPFADAPTPEELKKQAEEEREAQFLQAVKAVSSASETDEAASGTEGGGSRRMKAKIIPPDLAVVKETSSQSGSNRKRQYYKGMRVMSDTEEATSPRKQTSGASSQKALPPKGEADGGSASSSSHGSADEDFTAQRKAVRQKLNIQSSRPQSTLTATATKTRPVPVDEKHDSESSEDDETYYKRLEEVRQKQLEVIERRKAEAAHSQDSLKAEEKARAERLRQQQAMIATAQEKKRKEKEELMQKLKKQDEERKRRKREEKERKEREAKRYQDMLEEAEREKAEARERERARQREQEEAENREKRMREAVERRKAEWESTLLSEKAWIESGKTEFPSLFDKKCSFMSIIPSIPTALEANIAEGSVPVADLTFRRYKTLLIPLDAHISIISQSLLIQYFLQYSTMYKVHSDDDHSAATTSECFPFKCIGLQMAVAKAPLCKPSLVAPAAVAGKAGRESATRVLAVLVDTSDAPKTKLMNFNEVLNSIKLDKIFPPKELEYMKEHYPGFIKGLAQQHLRSGSLKDFPFPLKSGNAQLLEFENSDHGELEASTACLSKLAFFAEYTWQEGVPAKTDESWELFRRCPQFYAFNLNKPSYTHLAATQKKGGRRVLSKNNQYELENVCVVLKDLSYDPVVKTKANSSLAYLLEKACVKNGLDLCGIRLAYLNDTQRQEYYQLFHEKLEQGAAGPEQPVLAVILRGLDASSKVDSILGHFNPELARRADRKSLRACFGRSKEQNCVMHIFDQAKRHLDLKFWFGGRVPGERLLFQVDAAETAQELGGIQLVAPSAIEKQFLFLSPYISSGKLPAILLRLTALGVTILDIQKLEYSRLQCESGNIDKLKREAFFERRGRNFASDVGFVLKVCRENLASHFRCQEKSLRRDLDQLLAEHSVEDLMFMTSSRSEYQRVRLLLKRDALRTRYVNPHAGGEEQADDAAGEVKKQKRAVDYDSGDPEEYKDLQLYSGKTPLGPRLTIIQPVKSKADAAREQREKYQTSTCICFIKISSFKKQVIGETLHAILNLAELELLGLRVIHAKRELYLDCVPEEVQKIIKSVAYKFHELATELKLRRKLGDFRTLALVLRGEDVQGQLDKIYDRQKMKFLPDVVSGLDAVDYESTPHTLFVTNPAATRPLIDFIVESQYVKLYQDLKESYSHFSNSVHFHKRLATIQAAADDQVAQSSKAAQIKAVEDLLDQSYLLPASLASGAPSNSNLCSGVCVIKPNQPINVVMRALKSIANSNPEGQAHTAPGFLRIARIESVPSYSSEQLDLLFKHDIVFDPMLTASEKTAFKEKHDALFAGRPALQLVVHGDNALGKLKSLIGPASLRRSSQARQQAREKDCLRSAYGIDRVDNAFFISESVDEAIIEEDLLFKSAEKQPEAQAEAVGAEEAEPLRKVVQKSDSEQSGTAASGSVGNFRPSVSKLLLQDQIELALIVISPALVLNNDFAYVLDDFLRAKFSLCALKKRTLSEDDLRALFGDLAPKVHSLAVLEKEFLRGDSVLIVLEKAKAIESAQALIGKFGIKVSSDYEKRKLSKKAAGLQHVSRLGMGGGAADDCSLMREYGSYIFCFPNASMNQQKIAREFAHLPFSRHFEIASTS